MMRYGRFLSAKKVAMAMQSLVRSRVPAGHVDFVGFYSGATRIPEIALPLAMPKPVTVYDYQVRLECRSSKLDQAPQHFTNLHMGLQMARRILRNAAARTSRFSSSPTASRPPTSRATTSTCSIRPIRAARSPR